jgi:hypothetical protein
MPVPCFLLFLCFRKATQEIFSELDETEAEPPIFPKLHEIRRWDGGGPGARLTLGWCGLPLGPRHQGVRPPGPSSDASLPPIYSPRREKPKHPINFPETHRDLLPSLTRDRKGPEALPGTLPERGIATGGLLHRHACLRSDVWVVYLGLRVHSSS